MSGALPNRGDPAVSPDAGANLKRGADLADMARDLLPNESANKLTEESNNEGSTAAKENTKPLALCLTDKINSNKRRINILSRQFSEGKTSI